jgi:ATP synthase protein I
VISQPVKRFIWWQTLALATVALLATLSLGRFAAWSMVIGALIAYLALLYMTLQTFRVDAAIAPHLAVRAFYRGVAGRFSLATVLFALAFLTLPWLKAPALFLGFGVILITQWIGSARLALELTRQNLNSREC